MTQDDIPRSGEITQMPVTGRGAHAGAPVWVPVPNPSTIDDVLHGIDQVLDWSVRAENKIGYFAVLYKRITVAIKKAIDDGVFEDGARIEELDVVFARRYFDALNAYFYPEEYRGLTLPWEVSFVGDRNEKATILQHMMAGLNAHITFDLAPAVLAIARDSLAALEPDFNRVNCVLGSQVPDILDAIEELSPDLRWIRRAIPFEIRLLRRVVMKLRESAWLFAIYVAMNPKRLREREVNQASWTAAIGAWYLQPPARFTIFPWLVRLIAKREKPDVGHNILALQDVAKQPAPMCKALLPRTTTKSAAP